MARGAECGPAGPGVLAGVGADAGLRRQVHLLIDDLEMARQLQEARLRVAGIKDGHYDLEAGDAAYAAAFRDYGLDVDRVDPRAAAEQIRRGPSTSDSWPRSTIGLTTAGSEKLEAGESAWRWHGPSTRTLGETG